LGGLSMSNECTEGENYSEGPNRSPKAVWTNPQGREGYDYLGLNGQFLGKFLCYNNDKKSIVSVTA